MIAEPSPERERLATGLSAAPHTVRQVSAGDLRLDSARDWAPDVIVMTLGTDDAALALRMGMMRDPELAQVPFVVIGGSEDEARALGAHAFVRSPPPVDALVHLVGRFAAMRLPLPG